MSWRDSFLRAFRGESRSPGVLTVFKAVAVGTEREAEMATSAWKARRREAQEAREDRERYDEAARWLEERVKRSPAACWMPSDE